MTLIYNYIWIGNPHTLNADRVFKKSVDALIKTGNVTISSDIINIWYYDEGSYNIDEHRTHRLFPFPFLNSELIKYPFCKFRNIFSLLESELDPNIKSKMLYLFMFGFFIGSHVLIKEYFVPYLFYRLKQNDNKIIYMDASTYVVSGSIKHFLHNDQTNEKFILPIISDSNRFTPIYYDKSQFLRFQCQESIQHKFEVLTTTMPDVWLSAVTFSVTTMKTMFHELNSCQFLRLPTYEEIGLIYTSESISVPTFIKTLQHHSPQSIASKMHNNLKSLNIWLHSHTQKEKATEMLRLLHKNFCDWNDLSRFLIDPYCEYTSARTNTCFFINTKIYNAENTSSSTTSTSLEQKIQKDGCFVDGMKPYLDHNYDTAITLNHPNLVIVKKYGTGTWRTEKTIPFQLLNTQTSLFLPPPVISKKFQTSSKAKSIPPNFDEDPKK